MSDFVGMGESHCVYYGIGCHAGIDGCWVLCFFVVMTIETKMVFVDIQVSIVTPRRPVRRWDKLHAFRAMEINSKSDIVRS